MRPPSRTSSKLPARLPQPWRRTLLRVSVALCAVAGLLVGPRPACAADAPSREYQVKAAFVAKFVQFVDWPAGTLAKQGDPLVIAVVADADGRDPFNGALEQLVNGKSANGHPLKVRHVTPDNVGDCHALFVPASQDAHAEQALKAVAGHNVLTVGETDAFPHAGGQITFYLDDNKVRFEINPDAAKAAGVTISAKLLALARIVRK